MPERCPSKRRRTSRRRFQTTIRSSSRRFGRRPSAQLAQGAPEAAVTYLRRALEEPPPSDERLDVLYELGVAELNSNASEASEHLREAVGGLSDAAERPDILLAYSHSLIAIDQPEDAIEILQRTSDRVRESDRDLHLRLEARLIVGTQFDPAFHRLRTQRLEAARAGELDTGIGAALVLAQWAHEEARRGVSRESAIDYAVRAQAMGALSRMDELLFAMNSLYALALAGEPDEAARALTVAIAAAQRQGDILNLHALMHGQGDRALLPGRSSRRRRRRTDG